MFAVAIVDVYDYVVFPQDARRMVVGIQIKVMIVLGRSLVKPGLYKPAVMLKCGFGIVILFYHYLKTCVGEIISLILSRSTLKTSSRYF